MRELEDKILAEGTVLPGNVLKVAHFLNQQIDVPFMQKMGDEVARLYRDAGITKVLTIEASGIAFGYATALALGVPLVFAKKHRSSNLTGELLTASVFSYTHQETYNIAVSKSYISSDDVVLIVDDFLAMGNAIIGLKDLIEQAGATLAGAAVAIEKGFQNGGDHLRAQGIRIESLAIVDSMTDNNLTFRQN